MRAALLTEYGVPVVPGGRDEPRPGPDQTVIQVAAARHLGAGLVVAVTAEQRADALTRVLALAEAGAVRVAQETRPLADCTNAWTEAQRSGRRIVLVP